jgi:hypothetical protein
MFVLEARGVRSPSVAFEGAAGLLGAPAPFAAAAAEAPGAGED